MNNQIIKNSVLGKIKLAQELDQFLVGIEKTRSEIKKMKVSNKDLKLDDIRDLMNDFFEKNQKAALVVKDIESITNRIVGLLEASDLLGLELEFEGEEKQIIEGIKNGSTIFFNTKNGELVPVDEELINSFLEVTKERHLNDETLNEILQNI